MCGIAGIWHLDGSAISADKLQVFTDTMRERGPDGAGYVRLLNNTLGLGHRRLSILDLSDAGHQPMPYLDGRYHMTYNGEVFNFGDIRRELQTLGHTFRSDTDSEVILAAYNQWGTDCLQRFNGMWAFAIWDEQEQTLFMARDRFGIKPFYYHFTPGKLLAFASETRAFKHLEGFNRQFDQAMLELQTAGVRIHGAGHTIFQGIKSVLPGHCVTYKLGQAFEQRRWWSIEDHINQQVPKTLEEQAEKYHALLEDACSIRLVSDVPVATALSGGLDSSSVYSIVNDLLKKGNLSRVPEGAQKAVVATFPGLPSDERAFAEKALEYTGGDAIFIPQQYSDLPAQVTRDTQMFDGLNPSPITAISGIYRGMRENGITVSMDGHGVDEMQFGYRDMLYDLFDYYFKTGQKAMAENLRLIIIPTYAVKDQARVNQNLQQIMLSARSPLGGLKQAVKRMMGKPYRHRSEYHENGSLPALGNPYNFSHYPFPERMLLRETFVETLPDIFRNFDLAGMMNSVEIRMPFMDWRLVAYTFSLPVESKTGLGYNKIILRQAMQGRMNEEIRLRRLKIGISSPVQHWLNHDLRSWAMDMLGSGNADVEHKDLRKKAEQEWKEGGLSANTASAVWFKVNLKLIS
jgi:asparagine synthase (glutamine-hydrolysing)